MLKAPFEIGQVYWSPQRHSYKVTVSCPMCCGNKRVSVTIGTGETYDVECEECKAGYIGPRGFIEQWEQTPKAERFEIASIEEWRDGKWRVKSTTGDTASFDTLFTTEGDALAEAARCAAELIEHNMASQRKKKYGKVSSWSIQYHNKQIKEHERQAEWHRDKVRLKT